MAAAIYLAMTPAEFSAVTPLPSHICWMACHFSPYGRGLSNLPASLPADSVLIVNDKLPFCGHDISLICTQLQEAASALQCSGILLDFERPEDGALKLLTRQLTASLPCPVAVSDHYVSDQDCAVFLPPCPHHTTLEEYIEPWKSRQIWLDLAVDAETITLTKSGASIQHLPLGEIPEGGHSESRLHCHYSTETAADSARFTLWRTKDDLQALSREAEKLGVKKLIGLYQEWY